MYLTMALCQNIGSQAELVDHTLSISTLGIHCPIISTEVGGLNRMAIISVGPLLHRCGEADIPMPGGDRIGARPLDFHINGLQLMGAKSKRMKDVTTLVHLLDCTEQQFIYHSLVLWLLRIF